MAGHEERRTNISLFPWEGPRLFLVSFLVLFVELACIRWIPSYIRYLGYFSNFILLASFLGMGVGLLAARLKFRFLPFFPAVLVLLALIVYFKQFELRISVEDALYFQSNVTEAEQVSGPYLLFAVVLFVTILFATLSQEMGLLFDRFKPLRAYALNIGGSMAGIAAFFLISLLRIPPVWWFAAASMGAILLIRGSWRKLALGALACLCACVLVFRLQAGTVWSPYYRITMKDGPGESRILYVNDIGHQCMDLVANKEAFYHVPYVSFTNNSFDRALIIGAGSGSDAAIALHYGVNNITAVEIDPVIYQLGKENHPEHPYDDPRVSVVINDARAFLRNDRRTYDLIIYALPDSLTLVSSMANLRLESYLFTTECFRAVREHLAPGGLLVLYNYYREDWLIDKIAGMLHEVFGYPPAVVTFDLGLKPAVFMTGDKLKDLVTPIPGRPLRPDLKPATDDWPFLYMRSPTIPSAFIRALAMLGAFGTVLVLAVSPRGTLKKMSGHLFFLGAAFMLLETMSVVRFSLLFGCTWMVNSLVFFSVLAMVLLAIWISHRFTIRRLWILYAALFAILLLNYLLPLENLLVENATLRFGLSSLLLFSPIFMANLIFAQAFKGQEGCAAVAMASNVLGSLVGGLFEYSSLVTGYRDLVVLVAIFYALSFIFLTRAVRRAARGMPGKEVGRDL